VSYLAITEIIHLASAIAIFIPAKALFGTKIASLAFVGAFFIDADHMIDYIFIVLKRNSKFSVKNFFKANFFENSTKLYLIFHSWELTLFLISLYFCAFNPIFLVLGFSMLTHLLVDRCTNEVKPFSYLLIYRLIKGFSVGAVIPSSSDTQRK